MENLQKKKLKVHVKRINKRKDVNHDANEPKKYEGNIVIDVEDLLQHVQPKSVTGNSNGDYPNNPGYSNVIHPATLLTVEDDEYDFTSRFASHKLLILSPREDEYNSRPTLRGTSSSTSSLDNVCLVLEDENTNDNQKVWPDVSLLEAFSKEEIERFRRQALEDAEKFHFQYDETEEKYR